MSDGRILAASRECETGKAIDSNGNLTNYSPAATSPYITIKNDYNLTVYWGHNSISYTDRYYIGLYDTSHNFVDNFNYVGNDIQNSRNLGALGVNGYIRICFDFENTKNAGVYDNKTGTWLWGHIS